MTENVLWQPDADVVRKTRMTAFTAAAALRSGIAFADYQELYQWSINDLAAFWETCAEFVELKWQSPPKQTYIAPPSGKMLGAQWFPSGHLNYAENILAGCDDREVLVGICEGRAEAKRYSGRELRWQVARCASALRRAGVKKGDYVGAVMANVPEAIVAMLATTSIGAVWSSCSPDFGVQGIVDRLGQVQPKILFFSASYFYAGKLIDCRETIKACSDKIRPEHLVVFDHLAVSSPAWEDFLASAGVSVDLNAEPPLEFTPVEFNHPLFVMFSSGTTGVPKCIVHGTGGTLLQHKKELLLHGDLGPGDRLFFYTTCGWMMWNWMVSALGVGASLLVYDGSVAHPNLSVLWRIVSENAVTAFGTSPKFIATCIMRRLLPRQRFDLRRLRTVFSTGAPLLPEHFEWIYRSVGETLHLASISGGTDIISCFMLGNPNLPVVAGEIQCRGLGMAVEAWDATGKSATGQQGELVCVKPFVSMPVGFLHDDGGARYRAAYFEHYPEREVWRHGDFIEITARGTIIVYGRSDATLNPGGVRIGTAELYRQIETLPEIADSVAIGHKHGGDTRIVLFVKMADGQSFGEAVVQRVKSLIRTQLTPRHVPSVILPVKDIPYTRNGKKVEIAVVQAVHGEAVRNLSALANPEAIQEYIVRGQELNRPREG